MPRQKEHEKDISDGNSKGARITYVRHKRSPVTSNRNTKSK